ncbi:hypothetical protein PIB30_022776 [Stylosanthes scabra]|uniref:Glycosyltransferase n=1 Tax=Stylosanthes scabra TaxID=79078 RepID=A0ABU6SAQ6_9FABA|nr:hypothetical protein [Stylosanthes scabra]
MGTESPTLHIFFFPFMAHGHIIPTVDMAKLFASRGVNSTIVTTPVNASLISKAIGKSKTHTNGIHIETLEFPSSQAGLPDGCENVDLVPSEDQVPNVSSDSEPFVIPNLPGDIKLTRMQLPPFMWKNSGTSQMARVVREAKESDMKSYGVVVNSFYELERVYADFYRNELGRKAWHIGPLSLCNSDTEEKAQRGKDASIDENECLKWLNTKKTNSVVYICFGSVANFEDSQLREIALGLEASGQQFIWVVKRTKKDGDEWLPEGFEKRMEGKGLIIRGWAPQVLILEHQTIGAFVTHCGWNSTLEGVAAGVPMVTWPVSAEQFYNEKLVTEVLGVGVPVGAKKWLRSTGDSVKWEAVEKALKKIMVGEEVEEMRKKAKMLSQLAKGAVEKGGSSYSDLNALILELTSRRHP